MYLFKNLFSTLNTRSVKYLVVGGIAVNLYGIERSTADIDILMVLDEENLSKFLSAIGDLGLKPKMPVPLEDLLKPEVRSGWIEEKHMRVFTLYDEESPFFLLDILIDPDPNFDKLYENRTTIDLDGVPVPVISLADLVAMKERTGRPQDRADAFYLRKIMEGWKDGE